MDRVSDNIESAPEKPPRFIGKYEVRGELGHGGMAVVYRAHDPTLDREVAVKVLHPHLAQDPESRMRFEREAKAAARLRHPNIVEVYEFSEGGDDASFMVTEMLEGPTLRRFLEGRREIPAEVVASIGVVLCDALACAHAQGVVHRDVKPDNLLLSKGALKLTDFGIAHVADQREMTATGQVLGSPAHMAPEQIEGSMVDARTDIFATGTVLYALAAGRLPFDGPNPHSLLRKILDNDYPDPLRTGPKMGHRLAAIVRKCMSRIADDRYPDALSLRAALLAMLSDVGWDDPGKELGRYLKDPDAVTASLHATLVTKLPALGLAARNRGDLPEAMGYFNRALAIDPGNTKVLAMVRGAARAQRRKRAVRSAAIVAGAAAVSAVLAAIVLPKMMPPKPRPMLVAPQVVPVRVENRVFAPPMHETQTQRPALVVDAGSAADPARTAVHVGAPVVRRTTPPVAAAPTQTFRAVRIQPRPGSVLYSINGETPRPWNSSDERVLPVGRPSTIGFFLTGFQDFIWHSDGDVVAGDEPIRVEPRMRRVPSSGSPDVQVQP